MMRRLLQSNRGSSLIEIVVASAIFGFLVLSLSPSILSSQRSAAMSGNSSIAATLALDKIEELRGRPSSHPDLAQGTRQDPLNPLRSDATTGGIFERTWTVTNDVPQFGMKRLRMQVSWRDSIGQSSVELVTLVMP